jgi:hypothetical protein
MRVAEMMFLYKLNQYKNEHKDRFVLPEDKDIYFFTDVIDQIYYWFENIDDIIIENKEESKDEDGLIYTELKDVCDIQIGGTPRRDNPEFYGGNNLWVSVRELNNNIINDTKEHITDIGVEQSNVKLIPENTVLYSFKLSIGKIAITGKPLYTNEAIAGLLIKNKKELLTKYLYYALCFINTFSSKGCIGNGSLNKTSLGKVKIPIISIEKQNRIISFLDNLYSINGNIKNTIEYYKNNDIFTLLFDEKYEIFEKLIDWEKQSTELSIKKKIKSSKSDNKLEEIQKLNKLQEEFETKYDGIKGNFMSYLEYVHYLDNQILLKRKSFG